MGFLKKRRNPGGDLAALGGFKTYISGEGFRTQKHAVITRFCPEVHHLAASKNTSTQESCLILLKFGITQ